MFDRIRGVLSLSSQTFQEIEKDPAALTQAIIVVIVSSILAGLGGGAGEVLFGVGLGGSQNPTLRIVGGVLWALVAWLLWSLLTYIIGTRIFNGEATFGEMMRVIGFSYAPLAFSILSIIPVVGFLFRWFAIVWAIAVAYVGVKEGLDLETRDTVITVAIGGVLYLIGMGVILTVF